MLMTSLFSLLLVVSALVSPHANFRQGSLPPKPDSSYTILTLNACMMDGDLPTRWGGMTPAAERIDRLAEFILQEDPDVFLGQEIMSASGEKLYEHLKDNYTYFWIGIGNVPGKEESGLFVASKKLVVSGEFHYFGDENQVDKKHFPNQTRFLERGFFVLDLGGFLVATTHLEGGGEAYGGPAHRIHQLEMITQVLDQKKKPYLVAGDLNLNRTGLPNDEYTRSNIPRDYFDFYTTHHPEVNKSTFTCTNLYTAEANGHPVPPDEEKNEIDDYVLIRKPFQDRFCGLDVTLMNTYDENQARECALSDHKAYQAVFRFN